MEFPDWIRRYQDVLRLNTDEFADLIGVASVTIKRWRTGQRGSATGKFEGPGHNKVSALWTHAPPELRACAPAIFERYGFVNRDMAIMSDTMSYATKTRDAAVVAQDLDEIENDAVRRRASIAARACIDAIRTEASGPAPAPLRPEPDKKSGP